MRIALAVMTLATVHALSAWADLPARIMPKAAGAMIGALAADDTHLYAVGERGHVFQGTDKLEQLPFPLRTQLTDVAMADGHLWAVGWDAVIAHLPPGGKEWGIQHRDAERKSPLFSCAFNHAQEGIAVGAFGLILVTPDGGLTWNQVKPLEGDPHLYKVTADGQGNWLICGELGLVARLSPDGRLIAQYDTGQSITYFGIEPTGADSFIVYGLRGRIFRYADGKAVALESPEQGSIFGSTRAGATLYLCGEDGTVWIVSDLGVDKVRCHKLGERITLTSACVQGDTLVLGSTKGLRRIALKDLTDGA